MDRPLAFGTQACAEKVSRPQGVSETTRSPRAGDGHRPVDIGGHSQDAQGQKRNWKGLPRGGKRGAQELLHRRDRQQAVAEELADEPAEDGAAGHRYAEHGDHDASRIEGGRQGRRHQLDRETRRSGHSSSH